MARSSSFHSSRIVAFAVVVACGACSTSSESNPRPSGELDCEREGYPCTLGEVPATVLARGDELGADAYERISRGEPVADVAASLRAESDVVAVKDDEQALWFRLEGGRPHWVISDSAFPEVPAIAPSTLPPRVTKAAVTRTQELVQSPKDVVGPFPEEKRALVLSPYLYEFGVFDDGPEVAALLREATGYEDNVVFKANNALGERTIRGGDFKNWDAFDVVHVSTHGLQLCKSNGQDCDLLLFQGDGLTAEVDVVLETQGYVVVTSLELVEWAASDDFFRAMYPSGLSETIVSFSACETTKGPEFGQILSNPSSVFFGWSETVLSFFAYFATTTLFERLIDAGRTTEKVFTELVDNDLTVDPTGATLQRFQGGDDLRIRELITAYDPSFPTVELESMDVIDVVGIPGDGAADSMPFEVEIHGIEPGDADDYTLHISMNGVEASDSWTLVESDKVEDYVYRLRGEADFGVDLPADELAAVEFWIDLPEGGETRLKLELNFTSSRWRIAVAGLSVMRGPEVSAPSIVGFELDGKTVWQLALSQERPMNPPAAVLTIVDHDGRTPECTGQTGTFEAELAFVYTASPGAPAYVSDEVEDCMGEVTVDITSFSREEGLNIEVSGTMCKVEGNPSGEGVVATPHPVSGGLEWPAAGCASMPPAAHLLGSFTSSENPSLCQDIYSNSLFGMPVLDGEQTQYDFLCLATGAICTNDECSIDEIGNCDYRSDSAQLGFRGTVQHYGMDGDWPSTEDLQLACAAGGGVWSGG